MSDSEAPESPLVTYPPDAARPGYNYRDYYPDSPDPIYVPMPGDEGFVDQMTELEIAERSELSSAAQSDISQIAVCLIIPSKTAKLALTSLAGLRKTSALHLMRHFLK
jgi:hypothetical protein